MHAEEIEKTLLGLINDTRQATENYVLYKDDKTNNSISNDGHYTLEVDLPYHAMMLSYELESWHYKLWRIIRAKWREKVLWRWMRLTDEIPF